MLNAHTFETLHLATVVSPASKFDRIGAASLGSQS